MRLALITILLAAGCDGTTRTARPTSTSRGGRDASADLDGSPPEDASGADAGGALDASGPFADAGGPFADASARDAGFPDAEGPRDSGVHPDAATPDSGLVPYPYCRMSCVVPSDCVSTETPIQSAAHYRCSAGLCEYLGCRNDVECSTTFRDPSYGCHAQAGWTIAACTKRCATSSDCTVANAGTYFDADNYDCAGGYCEHKGCNDDGECMNAYRDALHVCRRQPGWPFASCVKVCAVSADCSTGSAITDADNYRCVSGLCEYTGCNTDQECRSTNMSNQWVCR